MISEQYIKSTNWLALSIAVLSLLMASCNIYRYVPENDKLYAGAKVNFTTKTNDESTIKSKLLSKTWPAPNSRILKIPYKLISYSVSKPDKSKGINHYFHEKLGEPPVLLSTVNTADMRRRMLAQMHDMGYLKANVEDSIVFKGRKAYSHFNIISGALYLVDTVSFPADTGMLSSSISASSESTLLKKGEAFSLDLIRSERERIDLDLRNQGYFYFIPDFLIIAADTNHNNKVKLSVMVKPDVPEIARKKYMINSFTIFSNYSSDRDSLLQTFEPKQYEGFKHVDTLPRFKAVLFEENIMMKEGQLYRYSEYKTTIQRMVNLNNFKFINTSFSPADTSSNPSLDVSLLLTPYTRRSLQAEIGLYSKSNNFAGTELKLKLTNRNLLHTGDHIDLDLTGGYEQLVKREDNEYYSNQNYSGVINFYTPRFYLPFRKAAGQTSDYIARNKISVGAEYLRKPKLYTMRSLRFTFGYIWKSSENWEHAFDPLVINVVKPTNITPAYDSTLAEDPSLAKSFEKQFIVGGEYTLSYSNQSSTTDAIKLYNNSTVNLSGNMLSLIKKPKETSSDKKEFFGIPYAQYLLLSNDFRTFMKVNNRITWANRIFMGYGYAFGNSDVMPYIKQFFIGGSNSMRAFRNGTLGPGTYTDSIIRSQAIQAGEIKLEYNSEIRLKLMKYIYPAVFVDAGNIWFRNDHPDAPGSKFTKNWYKELAFDAGAGLRIDAAIFVFRLDIAFPMRIPSNAEGTQWVLDDINLGSKQWRKDNLVFNIAFGYPF